MFSPRLSLRLGALGDYTSPMSLPSTTRIQVEPIASPVTSLPPIAVEFEVPEGMSIPAERLRWFASVRAEFPRLWELAMAGLQRHFDDLDDPRRVPDAVLSAGIHLLLPDEPETDDSFHWSLGFEIRDRQPWQGWEANFQGHRFAGIMFYA
ncbi:MAG: hypothetical protein INR62_03095 [Rhodospirillales bacterium]|nr:hypothetical protein [Acetobacter sp.]